MKFQENKFKTNSRLKINIVITFIYSSFVSTNLIANQNITKDSKLIDETIRNERSFSGPMGIGLRKSYESGNEKVCIYSTVQGQEIIKLQNNLRKCPETPPK